ncbi:hypothetical protein HPP92_010976 [Vanilla planifolia]|uniref:Uncharacterized protein n=1 Tax=Vanilla planifolia TaxID=51239 RepID=A0A835QY55_VANPL|nr:hypothetical protein HPP92_010976 [Vanilla planifolia]
MRQSEVVHVAAGHLPGLLADGKLLLAYGALRAVAEMGLGDRHGRQGVDGGRRCRRRAGAVVLGEVLDELVEIGPHEVVGGLERGDRGVAVSQRWLRRSVPLRKKVMEVEVGVGIRVVEKEGQSPWERKFLDELTIAAGADDIVGGG